MAAAAIASITANNNCIDTNVTPVNSVTTSHHTDIYGNPYLHVVNGGDVLFVCNDECKEGVIGWDMNYLDRSATSKTYTNYVPPDKSHKLKITTEKIPPPISISSILRIKNVTLDDAGIVSCSNLHAQRALFKFSVVLDLGCRVHSSTLHCSIQYKVYDTTVHLILRYGDKEYRPHSYKKSITDSNEGELYTAMFGIPAASQNMPPPSPSSYEKHYHTIQMVLYAKTMERHIILNVYSGGGGGASGM